MPDADKELRRELTTVRSGAPVRLVDVTAGREMEARLASMGVMRGATLTVIRSVSSGPLIVEVSGHRLMLGRGMARKMIVV